MYADAIKKTRQEREIEKIVEFLTAEVIFQPEGEPKLYETKTVAYEGLVIAMSLVRHSKMKKSDNSLLKVEASMEEIPFFSKKIGLDLSETSGVLGGCGEHLETILQTVRIFKAAKAILNGNLAGIEIPIRLGTSRIWSEKKKEYNELNEEVSKDWLFFRATDPEGGNLQGDSMRFEVFSASTFLCTVAKVMMRDPNAKVPLTVLTGQGGRAPNYESGRFAGSRPHTPSHWK